MFTRRKSFILLKYFLILVFLFLFSFNFSKAEEVKTDKFYSGFGDGNVKDDPHSNWENVHNDSDGIVYYNEATSTVVGSFAFRDSYRAIHRGFFPVHLEELPDNIEIESASLNIFISAKQNDYNNSDYDWFSLVRTTQATTSRLYNEDFDQCGAVDNPEEYSNRVLFSDIIVGQYNSWELNQAGFDLLKNNDGWARLGLRDGYDILDHPNPDPGTPEDWEMNHLHGYYSESGTSTAPYLEITYKIPDQEEKTPIIIIPGISASYLNNGVENLWPNLSNMLFDIGDDFLNPLKMDENGKEIVDLDSDRIIDEMSVAGVFKRQDYFKSLIEKLVDEEGYVPGNDLFYFPYDWRKSNAENAGATSVVNDYALNTKIEQVLSLASSTKVDLIAHSMGGLIAKKYIESFGRDKINKFIDIGTPHLGAPKAFKILAYGDNMGIPVLDPNRVRIISRNMPSIYELLPSPEYFNQGDDYNYYLGIFNRHRDMKILNYEKSFDYFNKIGLNTHARIWNYYLHSAIDNFSSNENTYNIVGCGQPTIGEIIVIDEKGGDYEYRLKYIDGDSTVPLKSAEFFKTPLAYSRERVHAKLSSADGTKNLVSAILDGSEDTFNYDAYSDFSHDDSICSFSGTQISLHSPIELHAFDSLGNHNGPNEYNSYDQEIPGSAYDIIDGNKFVFLPLGDDYVVEGLAESSGFFDARIERVLDGKYIKTFYFHKVELKSASTTMKVDVNDSRDDYFLMLDQDGDGIYEETVYPESDAPEINPFEKMLSDIDSLYKEGKIKIQVQKYFKARIKHYEKLYNSLEKKKHNWRKAIIEARIKIGLEATKIRLRFYEGKRWVSGEALGGLRGDIDLIILFIYK